VNLKGLVGDKQHDGIPVFLAREPDEPPDPELHAFYERLIRSVADESMMLGSIRGRYPSG